MVFQILRNARVLKTQQDPNLVVCWGGHSISRIEYDYTKLVGYHLGLRGLDVCTGCGAGAMKGPMKGATIGHSKQRIRNGLLPRHLGAVDHRRGITQSHRQPARDHARHREAPRSLRPGRSRHRRVPRWRGHRRGDPLPARGAPAPGQRRPADAAGFHRAAGERKLLPDDRRVRRRHAGAKRRASATGSSSATPTRSRG
jgi:hypothetical protein